MESSMAIHKNYGYIGDNRGNIICFNLNTLRPVWRYDNHDDTDSSPVIEVEDGVPYVYSGCEVDKQGDKGWCYLVKLNGLTGERVWEQKIECHRYVVNEKAIEGGMFATPLLGRGNCSNRIFVSVVTNRSVGARGEFYAIDKSNGQIIYSTQLIERPWMSPVGFLNENNEQFVVAGDISGRMYLIDGQTGELIHQEVIGANFEASPAVRDNHMVIGSRGRKYYKISVY